MRSVLCKSTKRLRHSLGFEPLEDRSMLAGTVTGSFDSGTGLWTITGDGESNQVRIEQNDDGTWDLIGLNGTLTAGDDDDVDPVNPVLSINADFTQGGNDTVTVRGRSGFGLDGQLEIATSDGNDKVTVTRLDDVEEVSIDLGGGRNIALVERVSIESDLDIGTGDGNDLVTVRNVTADDDDGFGSDIETGAGHDKVIVDRMTTQTMDIDTGHGKDVVSVSRSSFDAQLNVVTGDGDAGKDTVLLTSVEADVANVSLGDGNDLLTVTFCQFNESNFDGGDGDRDKLVVTFSELGTENIVGFERELFIPGDFFGLLGSIFSFFT